MIFQESRLKDRRLHINSKTYVDKKIREAEARMKLKLAIEKHQKYGS